MDRVSATSTAVVTVASGNYVPFARVLAASVRRRHPDLPIFLALSDEPAGQLDPPGEECEIVTLSELRVPSIRHFLFRHSRRSAAIASKPYAIEHVLGLGFETVLYIDADMLVLGDLGDLLSAAGQSPITLVPHLAEPLLGPDRAARELNILQSGVFNAGVLGVRASDDARRFLEWWQARIYRDCRHALADVLHFDQRWLDLVPAYFEDVGIYRGPEVNVAHWNLPERDMSSCLLFHFSGFDPDRPDVLTSYSDRLSLGEVDEAPELFSRYARALREAGWAEARDIPYAYERFDNGVVIPEVVRELYSELGETEHFGDPFACGHPGSFFRWLTDSEDGPTGTSRLWASIYARRPDVQHAFPGSPDAHQAAFREWARSVGAAEYSIPPELV